MIEENNGIKNNSGQTQISQIIPHSLCICVRCQKLCLIRDDFWVPSNSSQINDEDKIHPINQTNVNLYLNKNSKWKFQQNYDAFMDNSFLKNPNFFPLCPKCFSLLNNQISTQLDFCHESTTFYSSIPSKKENFIHAIQNDIHSLENDTSILNEVIAHQNNELTKQVKSKHVISNKQLNNNSEENVDVHNIDTKIEINQVVPSRSCGALGLIIVFHISTKRFYGCINKRRIGTMVPSNISTNEFDQGLYFLAQLVQNIALLSNIDTSCLTLTDKIYISKRSLQESSYVSNQDKNAPIPKDISDSSLHSSETSKKGVGISISVDSLSSIFRAISIPGISNTDPDLLVLTSQDLRFGRDIDDFNNALLLFLRFVSKVIHSDLFFGKYEPVSHLEIDGTSIDGVPFLYDKHNPEQFAHAMKLLLCELKRIQLKALQYEMSQI